MENSSNYIKAAKLINNEILLQKKEEKIKSLLETIITLKAENSELKKQLHAKESIDIYNKSMTELIKEMREENNLLIKKKDDEKHKLKLRLDEIEIQKEMSDLKTIRNNTLYNQKMSVIHDIELENKIYKEEVKDLKQKNEELKIITKNKINSLDILNQLKFTQFKQKMINNLKDAKNNVSKLNLEYMDLNGKITILQNHQLLNEVEFQKQQYDNLEKENKLLKQKVLQLEKELLILKKVSVKLAIKAKSNNLTNKNELNLNNDINNINVNEIKKNFSLSLTKNIFSNNIIKEYSNKNNNMKTINYTTNYNNNNNLNSRNSDFNLYLPLNLHLSSDMNCNLKNNDNNMKYIKYNKIIKRKNEEIEKLKILNDNIKNRLDNYISNNKSLFIFLEQCLNDFYQKLNETDFIKNINIKFENIKNFNFDNLSNNQKYGILCLLIKCLFPFIVKSVELNNIKEKLFKTNININLIKKDLQYNTPEKYAKEVVIKKSFNGRNILNNFFEKNLSEKYNGNANIISYKNNKIKESLNDSRIKNNKFKSVIN